MQDHGDQSFPRYADVLIFLGLYFGAFGIIIFLAPISIFIAAMATPMICGWFGAKRLGKALTRKQALVFSGLTSLATLACLSPFVIYVLMMTFPAKNLAATGLDTKFGLAIGAFVLLSTFLTWVFTLFGSWFASDNDPQEPPK